MKTVTILGLTPFAVHVQIHNHVFGKILGNVVRQAQPDASVEDRRVAMKVVLWFLMRFQAPVMYLSTILGWLAFAVVFRTVLPLPLWVVHCCGACTAYSSRCPVHFASLLEELCEGSG